MWGRVLMPEAFALEQTPGPVTCHLKLPLDATYLEQASFPSEASWKKCIAMSCLADTTSSSYPLQRSSKIRPLEFGNPPWTLHSASHLARITARDRYYSPDYLQQVRSWSDHFKIQCFFQFDCFATSISLLSGNVNKPPLPLITLTLG